MQVIAVLTARLADEQHEKQPREATVIFSTAKTIRRRMDQNSLISGSTFTPLVITSICGA